jgi:hypothetical protein
MARSTMVAKSIRAQHILKFYQAPLSIEFGVHIVYGARDNRVSYDYALVCR